MTTLVDLDDALSRYQPVMGLEVHIELNTVSKMFCGCATTFGAEPNTQVCPVCLGLPGSLPVVNATAVESAIRIGLALNCQIAAWCRFARKNYFYPDMPKNFQTSQYDEPIAYDGWTEVELDGETFRIEIERAHMEEDTGKSLHVGGATGRIHGADHSLVDYNRAGIPLIEIVTKTIEVPGEKAASVARAYVSHLRDLIGGLGVSDVRMDQGSLRCDVNLSLKPIGSQSMTCAGHPLGDQERQLVPFRRASRHLRDPAARGDPGRGGEGRAGDAALPRERRQHVVRTREVRRRRLPLLPRARPRPHRAVARLDRAAAGHAARAAGRPAAPVAGGVGLQRPRHARHRRRRRARPHRRARSRPVPHPQAARKWWLGELARRANEQDVDLDSLDITPEQVAGIQKLIDDGRVNDKLARQVFDGVLAGEGTPEEVVASRGLEVVSDDGALGDAVDRAIEANPDVAQKIRDGKVAAAGALIGAVMKEMRGQADAGRVRELILEKLG